MIFLGEAGSGKHRIFFLTKKTTFVRVDIEKEEGIIYPSIFVRSLPAAGSTLVAHVYAVIC
jgi:hypothetical protein